MRPQVEEWLRAAIERNHEGMAGSRVFLQLWDEGIEKDPIAVLQTGMAVLMDKPMFFVVPLGMAVKLPENLRRLARGVLEVDMSDKEGTAVAVAGAWVAEQMRALGGDQ